MPAFFVPRCLCVFLALFKQDRSHRSGIIKPLDWKIETPLVIEFGSAFADQISYSTGQFRVTGRRILNLVQLSRKAVKIVNRWRPVVTGNEGPIRIPMGGDH